jgi:SAM-dependent methyltransferase
VTEHLAAPHRALQEFHRVLRPGGLFLGNCSFMEPWHDESFFHVSPNGAAALLLQAGFRPRAIWPSYRYSGYLALLRMGNRATRLLGPAGLLVQRYSAAFYGLKRLLRGSRAYPPRAHLADLAITAGATDWIAQKPAA